MSTKRRKSKTAKADIIEGALPAEDLQQEFPAIALPIQPPFPPMEAKAVSELPRGGNWSYEPRIHPAESRIRKLSHQTPASYLVFDLLVDDKGKLLIEASFEERRKQLEELFRQFPAQQQIRLSPSIRNYHTAQKWLTELAAGGFDGVVAKQTDCAYASGERSAMRKIKRIRTADCVVGGFRFAGKGGEVGSLLLGLYDENGLLNHVGFSSSFAAEQRKKLKDIFKPYMGGSGFTGHAPGGPSRWSTERSGEWERLDPKLVCELRYDHFSGGRFRHGTKFLRWRPDKEPRACTYEQLESRARASKLEEIFAV